MILTNVANNNIRSHNLRQSSNLQLQQHFLSSYTCTRHSLIASVRLYGYPFFSFYPLLFCTYLSSELSQEKRRTTNTTDGRFHDSFYSNLSCCEGQISFIVTRDAHHFQSKSSIISVILIQSSFYEKNINSIVVS